jgi:hypothetical protein
MADRQGGKHQGRPPKRKEKNISAATIAAANRGYVDGGRRFGRFHDADRDDRHSYDARGSLSPRPPSIIAVCTKLHIRPASSAIS